MNILRTLFWKRKCTLVLLFALLFFSAIGQIDSQHRDFELEQKLGKEDWKSGTIQFNDQSIIKCSLSYNRFNGILKFKTPTGIEKVDAQDIQRFSIEDGAGVRDFISSTKKKVVTENLPRFFFEVLVECDSFKLMKLETASASTRSVARNMSSGNTSGSYYLGEEKTLAYEELLYFFDVSGNINHYITFLGYYSTMSTKDKKYVANKKLISHYLGERYTEVKAYAKKNRLSFTDRTDLVTILNYFKRLESN